MGNSADRAWQLSQLAEGVLTAFNPSHGSLSYGRPDIVCPSKLGSMMQPARLPTVRFSLARLWGPPKPDGFVGRGEAA